MPGKKRTRSDEVISQNDKRIKTEGVPAIEEEDAAFAPRPDVPDKTKAIAPVEVLKLAKKDIAPTTATTKSDAMTTKEKHGDAINWSEDESEIVDGVNAAIDAFPESEATSEDDIEIIIGDEADTTLIGSEDDVDEVKIEKIDGEEEPVDIKLTDETGKPQDKKVVKIDDTATKEKAKEDVAEKQKTEEGKVAAEQGRDDEYPTAGRDFIFRGVKASLKAEEVATWVGLGVVGATETRQITVDGVTVEVTVKLLEVKFDAPITKESNEVDEGICFSEEAGGTVLPTTEAPSKFTIDTAVASKSRDAPATQTASPATPSTVPRGSKLAACRFGDECKKQVTCMFDHSQPPTKMRCSFVNTNTGCSKGARCTYSHEHEGQMCGLAMVRKECPNTFKCAFLHMDDGPPIKAEETSKFQVPDRPVVREASAADIAERAAANRASREASAASAPPPNAPTGPKSSKRSCAADDEDTGVQAQRPRHNYQTPTHFSKQQLQPQQRQSMPGFALSPVASIPPLGGHHSAQGQFIPHHGFHNSVYAGNQQQRRGRGRSNGRTRGSGRGRGRGNARQNDSQQNGGGGGRGASEDHGIKVKDGAEGAGADPSESRIRVQVSVKKA